MEFDRQHDNHDGGKDEVSSKVHLEVSIGKGGYQEAKRLVGGVNRMVGNSCWSKTNLVMMFDDKAAASDDDDADVDTLGARAGVFNETGRNCRCRGLITHHRHHQPRQHATPLEGKTNDFNYLVAQQLYRLSRFFSFSALKSQN